MIRTFFKDSFLYTLANLFTKGIGFVMLPVYLNFLDKVEYGTYDYVFTIGSFIAVIVSLEITQSVLRFSSEAKSHQEKSLYITNGVFFNFVSYTILLIIGLFFIDDLSLFLTGQSDQKLIAFLALISYFVTSTLYMSSIVFRSNLDSKSATISSAFSAAIVAILGFVGLNAFEQSLIVILLSTIIGQLVVVVYNYSKISSYWLNKPNYDVLKKMLLFSSPLVLSSLGVILSTLVDRMVIKELLGFSELAEYGVAARFASIVTLITLGFQSALAPLIYSQLDNPNVKSSIKKLFSIYCCASLIFLAFLFFVSDKFLLVIVGDNYHNSAYVFVLLSCAMLIQSAYVFFPGLSISGKTKILAIVNIAVGFINLLGNYMLVPVLGIEGAAYSTLFCSVLFFLINMFFSEKEFPIFQRF
ncbi:oligosaccharide flippase family protein [Vibrio atypicus]|uniref:oligosaccharide flippase family protein n=1 Tax=Vibrio atypicus TaxID=558271 RepID=UPI00135CB3F5|nr:oligosaccharide flippase family protein [Vibrio atypicus]